MPSFRSISLLFLLFSSSFGLPTLNARDTESATYARHLARRGGDGRTQASGSGEGNVPGSPESTSGKVRFSDRNKVRTYSIEAPTSSLSNKPLQAVAADRRPQSSDPAHATVPPSPSGSGATLPESSSRGGSPPNPSTHVSKPSIPQSGGSREPQRPRRPTERLVAAYASSSSGVSTEPARVAPGRTNRGKSAAYLAFASDRVEELSAKNGNLNATPTTPFSIKAQKKKEAKLAQEAAERRAQAEAESQREAERRETERWYFLPYHG